MKNSSTLAFVLVIFVAVGCSCPKLNELANSSSESNRSSTSTPTTPSTPDVSKAEYQVSMEKFGKIKVGMSRKEVENIIGGKGTEYYSGTGGGVSFVSVKWEGEKFKTILVSFPDDKVTSKSQVGLDR